jgi:hypothetical protein
MHLAFRSKPFYFSKIKSIVFVSDTHFLLKLDGKEVSILHSTRPVIGSCHSYNVSNLIISLLPNATQNTCEQHRVIFQQLLLDLKNNDLNVVIVIESIRNNLKKPVIFHTFWLLGHLKNTCPLSSSSIFTKHKRACNPLLYPSIRHGSKSNYFTFDGALTFHTKFQLHTNT